MRPPGPDKCFFFVTFLSQCHNLGITVFGASDQPTTALQSNLKSGLPSVEAKPRCRHARRHTAFIVVGNPTHHRRSLVFQFLVI